jgi:hypothetical protein
MVYETKQNERSAIPFRIRGNHGRTAFSTRLRHDVKTTSNGGNCPSKDDVHRPTTLELSESTIKTDSTYGLSFPPSSLSFSNISSVRTTVPQCTLPQSFPLSPPTTHFLYSPALLYQSHGNADLRRDWRYSVRFVFPCLTQILSSGVDTLVAGWYGWIHSIWDSSVSVNWHVSDAASSRPCIFTSMGTSFLALLRLGSSPHRRTWLGLVREQ